MRDALAVRASFWTDHSQPFFTAYQFTVINSVNTFSQLILGIWFGLAAQSLSVILYRAHDRISSYFKRQKTDDRENTPLLGERDSGTSKKHGRLARSVNFAFVFLGWAVATGLVSNVPTNNFGIADSQTCGVWNLKNDSSPWERDSDDLIQANKEIMAGYYARNCYAGRSDIDPTRCTQFAQTAIDYRCDTAHCPFKDHSFCYGTYQAVQCSTAWIGAAALGINSRRNPKFRKTMTCSPIDMNAGFVYEHEDESGGQLVDYYLGPFNGSLKHTEFTFRQHGIPFTWAVPTYSVSAFFSSLYRDTDFWKPLTPALDRHPDTYLTVIFIVSARIFYTEHSRDYIFRARRKYPGSDYFYNSNPEYHPLACVEQIEISASDGTVYPRIDKEHTKNDTEYEYVRSALRRSTVYDAIQSRGANALDAQEKIRDMFSLPLASNQWAVESEYLFATSLARAQYNARDIAVGFGHDNVSYVEETLPFARGKLCGLYRFPLPMGYTNINIVAYVGFLLVGLLMIVLGYGYAEFEDEEQRRLFRDKKLVCEWIFLQATKVVRSLWSRTIGTLGREWRRRNQNAGHQDVPNLLTAGGSQVMQPGTTQRGGNLDASNPSLAANHIAAAQTENDSSRTRMSGNTLVPDGDTKSPPIRRSSA